MTDVSQNPIITSEEAKSMAQNIGKPVPGELVNMPLIVFLQWAVINKVVNARWRGSFVVVDYALDQGVSDG